MQLTDFFPKVPESFVVECLEALPGGDRRRLLQRFNSRVKMSSMTLNRKVRTRSEARKLYSTLERSEDVEEKRSLFQGWLARHAQLIVALLDSWEIEHEGGFVEDFDWVSELDLDKLKASMASAREAHPELATDRAFMVYFAYLEVPCLVELFDIESIFSDSEAKQA